MPRENDVIHEVDKKISVVIPCFNPNDYLFQTLENLYQQTLTSFEIILVDDGSSKPGSDEIFDQARTKFRDVRIVKHFQNKGLPAARNTGIAAATSEYVFFIDDDDLLHPTALEKYYLTLVQNPEMDFVNSYVVGFGAQDYRWKGGFHESHLFLSENRNTSCFITRRKIFDEISFDEALRHGCEDWDFWLNAASHGLWGYTIPEFLFYYRRRENREWDVLRSNQTIEKMKTYLNEKYGTTLAQKGFPVKNFRAYGYHTPDDISLENNHNGLPRKETVQNVLYIVPWLEIGGADKFNLDVISGLKEKGYKITIACTLKSEHPWLESFLPFTADIFLLNNYTVQSDYHKVVSHLMIARDIQLVFIANSLFGYYLSPYIKLRFPQIPIVDYIHCEDPDWLNGGYPRINSSFADVIDETIVSSQYLKNYLLNLRPKDNKGGPIEICYTNIDSSLIRRDSDSRQKIRAHHKIPDDMPVILFSARMVEQKQPFVLAETLKKLFGKVNRFVCVVAGDGPLLEPFKEAIRKSGLDGNVICLGFLDHKTNLQYMDAADIFLLTSAYEGIALSFFEAMAKGLVLVGARVGGHAELVNKECGFLINRSTPGQESDEYAEILSDLIAKPEKRAIMGQTARSRIESEFDIRCMFDKMDHRLQTVKARPIDPAAGSINARHYLFLLNQFMNEERISNVLWNEIVYLRNQTSNKGSLPASSPLSTEDASWYRSEHQKLKEWYAKEYEVLPLWYKRIGHLIKVMTGQRTLRSLFK